MILKKTLAVLTVMVLLLNFSGFLAQAGPSVPHTADSMWVEPTSVVFTTSNASVGQKFNVTVWMNITENVFSYQIGLHYNRTQLMCTRAGYTAGMTSNYFKTHTTSSEPPIIDTSTLGNGSVLAFETLEGNDFVPGPHCDSLVWVEFEILQVPSVGNLTSTFDISTEYPSNTWVLDQDLNNINFVPYNANYLFIGPSAPPPPPPLTVSITASSTSVYLGQSVVFSSYPSGGYPSYSYQWFLNATASPGATLINWTWTPNATGSATVYVQVTDSSSQTIQSTSITVTVLPALTGAKIYVDPSQIIDLSLGPGSIVSINVSVANVATLGACVFNITYDPTVLTWTGFDLLPAQGQYPTFAITGNSSTGFAWVSLYYLTPISALLQPLTGLRFVVNSYGITLLNLTDTHLYDQNGNPIVHNTFSGIFANIIRDVAVTNVVPALPWVY